MLGKQVLASPTTCMPPTQTLGKHVTEESRYGDNMEWEEMEPEPQEDIYFKKTENDFSKLKKKTEKS